MRSLRAIATAFLLAAVLMLGLMPAAAQAAGPGVTLFVNTNPQPIDLPGDQFAGGVSIRSLLTQNGVNVAAISFVTIARGDGGLITLQRADLSNPSARITDNGTTTRFAGGSAGTSVTATNDTGPLQINVNGGDISVIASVDRRQVDAGTTVTFSVRVRFAPPGAQLDYEWDFGDGTPPKSGMSVRHTYKFANDYQARVSVSGSAGSTQRCATECVGTDDVDVTVGEPPQQPTSPTPGAGTGDPNGAGSGTGTGAGGQGGAGGTGAGTGTTPSTEPAPAVAAKPKPKPKPKKPFGVTISGVLITDPGDVVSKLPSGTQAAGAPRGERQSAGGDDARGIAIPLTGLLAMTCISLGALRERRGVKLRLA